MSEQPTVEGGVPPVEDKTLYERVTGWIVVPVVLGVVAVGFAGVLSRHLFGGRYALFWAEEVMRYGFIWIFWLCVPILAWRGSMFAVDIIINAFPINVQRVIRVGHSAATLVLMGFLIYYGWSMAQVNGGQVSSALRIQMFWIYLAIPVGAILISIVCILQILRILRGEITWSDQ